MSRYLFLFQFKGVEHGERGLITGRIAYHISLENGMNHYGMSRYGSVLLDERFEKTRFRRSVEGEHGIIEIADDGSEVRVIEDLLIEGLSEKQIDAACTTRLKQLHELLRSDLQQRYQYSGMGWNKTIEERV